jgi:poly(A) RNA polymerase
MSSLDNRFPALLCAIRTWAASRKITNPIPGKQPTNFMLVLLLVYYLQSQKVLPTLDVLFNNPGKDDTRITADGIDCTFLREPDKILKFFTPQNSSSSLAELLYGFFEFFSEFDFNSKGISLYTGSSWGKPDSGPMYLQNPLEMHLNVSRNVSREEVVRFKSKSKEFLYLGKGLDYNRN